VRPARAPSEIFRAVHAGGGFTQINHPRIFPSEVPGFDFLCRGCPWDYSAGETDYRAVDAIEIATGPAGLKEDPQPGPNPFTPLAIQFWEDAIDAGGQNSNRIAAVGSSDSHNAGRTPDPVTQSPIGQATTVVYADELSERGIQRGVQARHTYVKVFGNDGPDLRFEARTPGSSGPPAIMGDAVPGGGVEFTARVIGGGPGAVRPGSYTLFVLKDGAPLLSVPVTSADFSLDFPEAGAGRYRLQLQRESAIEAVSSPIWVEPPGYPRPQSATKAAVSLVPAYRACESPNRRHGPPLAADSCHPPVTDSSAVRVGTPARSVASARLAVLPGDPHTSADEADVRVAVAASDVVDTATGDDYAGGLTAHAVLRITDRASGLLPEGGSERATVSDLPFDVAVQCAATAGAQGGACSVATTVDTLYPGAVTEGRRAVWELGQVEVLDAAERPFLRQGIFVP
jgi:hypothetical protein